MNGDLEAQQQINLQLLEKIQRYKCQKFFSEDAISSSQTVSHLRQEAAKLIKIIDEQNQQISQLKQFEISYQKKVSAERSQSDQDKTQLLAIQNDIKEHQEKRK